MESDVGLWMMVVGGVTGLLAAVSAGVNLWVKRDQRRLPKPKRTPPRQGPRRLPPPPRLPDPVRCKLGELDDTMFEINYSDLTIWAVREMETLHPDLTYADGIQQAFRVMTADYHRQMREREAEKARLAKLEARRRRQLAEAAAAGCSLISESDLPGQLSLISEDDDPDRPLCIDNMQCVKWCGSMDCWWGHLEDVEADFTMPKPSKLRK